MLRSYGGCVSNNTFYPGGVLHSAMPIKIVTMEVEKFFSWLLEQ